MSEQVVKERIEQALPQIFAYALKRTHNRHEAEDLSQEIVLNLYTAVAKLRDPDRFYGWMWGVANNVYKVYLRKEKRQPNLSYNDENTPSPESGGPEAEVVDKEQLGILYRELSILSGLYRQCMVLYYLKGKSGDEIATHLGISTDMVKQYLFKSRRKVREGMSTIRERGERSFDPGKFNIHFWGESGGNVAAPLFQRKLPGNIMLETYYEPLTVEQLSMELGVASVYLEDEISILLKNGLLRESHNQRYQSNIVIFTSEFESELNQKTHHRYRALSEYLYGFIGEHEEELRAAGFGSNMSRNTLFWQTSTLCLVEAAAYQVLGDIIREYPVAGYRWGLERSHGDNLFDFGIHRHSDRKGNQIHSVDFAVFGKQHHTICQRPAADMIIRVASGHLGQLSETDEDILSTLIQDGYVENHGGRLALTFPVLSSPAVASVKEVLMPAMDWVSQELRSTLPLAESLLLNHVPTHLRAQVPPLAALKQTESFVVHTMHNLYLNRYIELSRPCTELLTAFVELVNNPEGLSQTQ